MPLGRPDLRAAQRRSGSPVPLPASYTITPPQTITSRYRHAAYSVAGLSAASGAHGAVTSAAPVTRS
jgi:hypothetical protein